MRTRSLVVLFGLFLVVGTLGYGLPARAQDLTGQFGGSLGVALRDFGSTDPLVALPEDRAVLELIYDSLGRIDPVSLAIEPWAATAWSWDGASSIMVTLRDDLMFSDGTPYDADDVAFALSQYTTAGVSRWEIAVVDAMTVQFDFTTVDPNEAGPGFFWTEGLTAFIAWDAAGANKYSGPFAVSSQAPGMLSLAANPNHFAGRPFLDSVNYMWPFTLELNPDDSTQANDAACALMFQDVHLIGWTLLPNDLTNLRDCTASHGGFPDMTSKSLVNPNATLSVPHVQAAKNPGNDFLYFGFTYNAGSMFIGGPGSEAQTLRSGIYQFVNKGTYKNVEPSSEITHGPINPVNWPWAPVNCPPWTPCEVVVDAGFTFNPDPAFGLFPGSNSNPGKMALDAAGFLDTDGDGIRELSSGAPISFTVLSPSFALDGRKAAIAGDILTLLGLGGLSVSVDVSSDTWSDLDLAVAACTSCMYVKRFTPGSQLPDWLYTMPEIPAANDPMVNLHLNLAADMSWTSGTRALHVGHVTHLLGEAADFLPMLNFDALDAFDFQTFDGWVDTLGGIHNFWSLTSLRLPALGGLTATLDVLPTANLGEGDTATLQVSVQDLGGQPVTDATVTLARSAGTVGVVSGGANGVYEATYTAPATVADTTDVTVYATVTRAQYSGSTAMAALTVHAPGIGTLDVAVGRSVTEIDSGGSAQVTVQVTDSLTGGAVSGASVVLHTNLPGATITPASGTTDASGTFQAMFSATVSQGMTYRITADVDAGSAFETAESSTSLAVRSELGDVTPIDVDRNVPGFEAIYAIAAIAAVFAIVALARRRED